MIERNVGTEERKTAMTQWEQKLERLKSVCGYGMMIKGISSTTNIMEKCGRKAADMWGNNKSVANSKHTY